MKVRDLMDNTELAVAIQQLEEDILEKKETINKLKNQIKSEPVKNYSFLTADGKETSLLELFGQHSTLIVIHNMGKSCSYCTMWADGFTGIYDRLSEKTSFVLSSPDQPSEQKALAMERDWIFPMISTSNTENKFKEDMGFLNNQQVVPGLSVFLKQDDSTIVHHTKVTFGPGDHFGVLWHLLDLLPSEQAEA